VLRRWADRAHRDDQANLSALRQGLAKLGWIEGGRNVRIDVRFGAGEPDRIRAQAAELVGLAPDVIFANGGAPEPARRSCRTGHFDCNEKM
jgi:hypothetical protein